MGHEEKRSSGILVESCLTCLVAFCDEITGLVDEGKVLDVFYLKFNKGFLHCHSAIRQSEAQTQQMSSVMDLKLTEMP